MFEKLASLLRSPLLPLYEGCTEHAIDLATSILKKVLDELAQHLLDTSGLSSESVKEGWEKVAEALISGIMVSGERHSRSSCVCGQMPDVITEGFS